MNTVLRFELRNLKWKPYLLLLVLALIIALFFPGFFHLVGVDQIELQLPLIFDLSLSISSAIGVWICGIAISVIYANYVLPNFLEEMRFYTYLLPGGRKIFFATKTWTLWFLSFAVVFVGFAIPYVGYYLIIAREHLMLMIAYALISAFFIAGISSAVGIISGLIGLLRDSSIVTILSAVVIGALLANSFANSAMGVWSILIELILFICTVAISILGLIFTKRHISKEDVF